MERQYKQPFIVENRPGAVTQIGTEVVVRAQPNGETLLVTANPVASEQVLNKAWPFRVERDLKAISMFAGGGYVLITSNKVPAGNLREFAAYAKASPGVLNQAVSGGTSIESAMLLNRLGITMEQILYKGGPLAVQSIVAGDTHYFGAAVLDVVELAKGGKLKLLAYTERERHPLIPNVPTVGESGVGLPDWDANFWFALLGPAGLPDDIANRLSASVIDMLKTKEVLDRIAAFGLRAYPLGIAESRNRINAYVKDIETAVAAGVLTPK
jgi:tripartite-type tricarboxylate transporter receptor subunit TctC